MSFENTVRQGYTIESDSPVGFPVECVERQSGYQCCFCLSCRTVAYKKQTTELTSMRCVQKAIEIYDGNDIDDQQLTLDSFDCKSQTEVIAKQLAADVQEKLKYRSRTQN